MYGQNRSQMRQFFISSWRKHESGQPMQPMESLIAGIIQQHPEYHPMLKSDSPLEKDYTGEDGQTNPFLHMGMHITLAEHLNTDRPKGIRELHQQITRQHGDAHAAEHQMMECLGLVLWEARQQNRMPDETAYLSCLKKLVKKKKAG
jgi:hypothetical protein